ncbi:DUF58 domain-containing protein [Bacillus spongiae]|uniref:DUF58 domain-containing protein n=1 Tax=Bacillus spongiae TaxID=2683610 RepID=A0ABU8HGG3_9BACI
MKKKVEKTIFSSSITLCVTALLFLILSFFPYTSVMFLLALLMILVLFSRIYLSITYRQIHWKLKQYTLSSSVEDVEEYFIEVVNDSAFPLFQTEVILESENEKKMVFVDGNEQESSFHKMTLYLRPKSRKLLRFKLKAKSRGYHTLSHLEIVLYDPFRLTAYRLIYPESRYPEFEVFPRFNQLSKLHLQSLIPGYKTTTFSPFFDETNIIGTKDYENESFRHIHWLATAKENRMMAKKYERVHGNVYSILLNFVGNGFFHLRKDMEELIEYTVSICTLLARDGCDVELFVNYSTQTEGILHVKHDSNKTDIKKLIQTTTLIDTKGVFLSTNHFFDYVCRVKNPHSIMLVVGTASEARRIQWTQVKP